MKRNNSNKPFFKEGRKDSDSSKSAGKSSYQGKSNSGEKGKDFRSDKPGAGKKSFGKKDDSFSKPSFGKKPDFKGSFGEKKFGSKFKSEGANRFDKKPSSGESRGRYSDSSDRPKGETFGPKKFEDKKGSTFGKKQFFTKREDESSSERPRRDDFSAKKFPPKDNSGFANKPSFGSKPERFSSYDRPKKDGSDGKKFEKREGGSFEKKNAFGTRPERDSSSDRPKRDEFGSKNFEKRGEGNFDKKPSSGNRDERSSSSDRPKRDEFGSKNFERRGEGIFDKNPSSGNRDESSSSSDRPRRDDFEGKKFEKKDEGKFAKKPYPTKRTDNSSFSNRPKRDDSAGKRSESGDDFDFDRPAKKDVRSDAPYSNEGGKGMVYKGRGRDQKPVFEPKKEGSFQDKPAQKQGFGKNRFRPTEENLERPDYNFDALPAKKAKGKEEDGTFRLNKYISNSGICGRREADQLIAKGLITVNGEVTTELGLKVKRTDRVVYQGKKINPEKPVYVLLNKPKDFITTTEDPMERKTVMSLVNNACEERIFPVGRLDRNTTGLLLFTNDGELAAKLSHPSNQVKKIYQVTLDNPITQKHEEAIREGLTLEDGPVTVDDMQVLSKDRTILGLEIHIGRNRIVRRLFAHLGYEVTALDRVMYAGLDKKDLKRGHYRFLSEQEVIRLKYFV